MLLSVSYNAPGELGCVLSRPMIERLAAAVTGPRGRWATIAVWIALAIAGFAARTQIGEVTAAGQASYLPSHAESTQVLDVLQRDFKGGDDVPVLVVFEHDGGLTGADLDTIGRLGEGLEGLGLSGATPVFAPFSGQAKQPLGDVAKIARGVGPISRDGEAALVALAIDANERGAVLDGVSQIRAYLRAHRHPGPGVRVGRIRHRPRSSVVNVGCVATSRLRTAVEIPAWANSITRGIGSSTTPTGRASGCSCWFTGY